MPPLPLAQDRLARGQNPTPRPTSGPSRPQSTLPRPDPNSPLKVRVPKGVPAHNDRGGKTRVEAGEELATPGAKENEMWEDSQRRHKAAVILGSWEMVTWYGIAGDESNPQTALRLKRMMLGIKDTPGSDQWEDERNPGDDDSSSSGRVPGSSPQSKGGPKRKH